MEDTWERIHQRCGHRVDRQPHVPEWDRWNWRCPGCGAHGKSPLRPVGPCSTCGTPVDSEREEAILDLEVQSVGHPRQFLDITVRYGVPGDADGLRAAAEHDGAVNRRAESDKHSRYPRSRAPWKMTPLALETFGRHGTKALNYLRRLAREQLQHSLPDADDASSLARTQVQQWGSEISVALQRATARQLRSAAGTNGVGSYRRRVVLRVALGCAGV